MCPGVAVSHALLRRSVAVGDAARTCSCSLPSVWWCSPGSSRTGEGLEQGRGTGLEGLKGPSNAHSFLQARAAPWEWVCPRCGLEGPVAGTSANIFRRFPFPLRDKLKLSWCNLNLSLFVFFCHRHREQLLLFFFPQHTWKYFIFFHFP